MKAATRRRLLQGDGARRLGALPDRVVDLVFTSPPYFNARPEYADYVSYEEYLEALRDVFTACHRVLNEGRFMVVNTSPVLVPRPSRSGQSSRIPVSFHVSRLLEESGFDFVDHIIWEKPEGAGWATGRGRRFAADRQPLQYKAVPVTEDILVFRKHTDRLIDWNLKTYPDQEALARSRVGEEYARTNVWRIPPARDKRHPAVFPDELARRVISYYSIEGDTVLDPFAGIGTTGRVASRMGRGYVMIDRESKYVEAMRADRKAGLWDGPQEPSA